jgi:hypothetical protein
MFTAVDRFIELKKWHGVRLVNHTFVILWYFASNFWPVLCLNCLSCLFITVGFLTVGFLAGPPRKNKYRTRNSWTGCTYMRNMGENTIMEQTRGHNNCTTTLKRGWHSPFLHPSFFVCRTTKLLWNTWVRSRNFRHQPWKFRDSKPNWCPSWHRTRSHRLHSQRQHSATYGGGHGMSMKIHHPRAEECWGIASPFPQFYLSCKWV